MGAGEPYYRLPVNMWFVALALRSERPDVISYLDLDTGGVFTLLVGDGGQPLVEGLDLRLRHHLEEHPERFVTIDPLTAREKADFVAGFAGGLGDEYLRRRMLKASEADVAFDACEGVLRPYPELLLRWRESLEGFLLSAAAELLRENSIRPQITFNPG
jgi:hypothetical protein